MNDSKERIEKAAKNYSDEFTDTGLYKYNNEIKYEAYIAGATAEHERSQKEIAELKAMINELLPLAEFLLNNTWRKSNLPENTHGIIIKAKKLIGK